MTYGIISPKTDILLLGSDEVSEMEELLLLSLLSSSLSSLTYATFVNFFSFLGLKSSFNIKWALYKHGKEEGLIFNSDFKG